MIERALPGAHVAFTTRHGGVSDGPYESLNLGLMTGDRDEAVAENRRRVAADVGVPIVASRQLHGVEIRDWGSATVPFAFDGEADGHIATAPGVAPLVLVADCLPVALAAPGRVAMLHCGWRGLAGGIVERALARFEQAPAALIGPGIGPCCYEVGRDVLDAFGIEGGRTIDLKAIARAKLEAGGVAAVDDVGLCTSCRPDLFFSHRRDSGVTGRQAGIAWLA